MNKNLSKYFKVELTEAHELITKGDYQKGWYHLERAHILGQPYFAAHTLVHWKMLCFGIKIKDTKEIIGQIPRLLFGGVKSFVGKIPIGNTGGANLPPLKSMEIPADLKFIIEESNKKQKSCQN